MRPEASTPVDTVTSAVRPAIVPRGVSTATPSRVMDDALRRCAEGDGDVGRPGGDEGAVSVDDRPVLVRLVVGDEIGDTGLVRIA